MYTFTTYILVVFLSHLLTYYLILTDLEPVEQFRCDEFFIFLKPSFGLSVKVNGGLEENYRTMGAWTMFVI